MSTIRRGLLIVLAYAVACIVAATIVQALYGPGIAFQGLRQPGLGGVPALAMMLGLSFAAPAAIIITIAELTGRNGWRYFALSGLSVALAIFGAYILTDHWFDRPGDYGADNLVIAMIAGSLAGVVYWLIAGRSAGAGRKSTVGI